MMATRMSGKRTVKASELGLALSHCRRSARPSARSSRVRDADDYGRDPIAENPANCERVAILREDPSLGWLQPHLPPRGSRRLLARRIGGSSWKIASRMIYAKVSPTYA